MSLRVASVFLVVLAGGCAPAAPRRASTWATSTSVTAGANPFTSAPLASGDGAGPAGSGVPLDAPVTDVKAADGMRMQGLARGSGTASDGAIGEGDEAYRRGDFVGAQKAYERAAKLGPKDAAAIVGMVRARLSAEKAPVDIAGGLAHPGLEQAVRELERAVRLEGKFAPAHVELGRTLLVLGRVDHATAVLRRAVELTQDDAEAHSALGVALLATGNVESAARELEVAAGIESESAVRFKNWGTALLTLGKSAEAVRAFQRAAQLAPADARIQNDLGTALLTLGETDRAIGCLQLAVKRDPRRATYRSNLGYAWGQKGNLGRAMVIYREALALDESLVSAWVNLGNIYARRREFALAREAYDKAMAIDPEDPRIKAVVAELAEIEQSGGGAKAPAGGKP